MITKCFPGPLEQLKVYLNFSIQIETKKNSPSTQVVYLYLLAHITFIYVPYMQNKLKKIQHKIRKQVIKLSDLFLPREKPSLWTSQTFSDPYQACSAAICSSVLTWLTKRTRIKMTGHHSRMVTLSLYETASTSSLIPAMC